MKNRLTNLGLSIVTDKLLRGEKQTTTKIEHMIRLDIKIKWKDKFSHIFRIAKQYSIIDMLTVAKMYCINAWTIVLHHMHDLPYLTLEEIVLKLKFKTGEHAHQITFILMTFVL